MADTTEVDFEQEVLRYQMEESREALAQKMELLEEKVTETVQSATATVADATATVMETVQNATASVTDTVDSVTTAVQGTVDSVRSSVEETVDTVKSAFDLESQCREHPWLMFGGAVAVGYLVGNLLREPARTIRTIDSKPNDDYQRSFNQSPSTVQSWKERPFEAKSQSLPNYTEPSRSPDATGSQATSQESESWIGQLNQNFGPEINKLQNLAVGVALGSFRDVIVEAVPEPLKQSVKEIVDGFTEKLGGKPIAGPVLSGNSSSSH